MKTRPSSRLMISGVVVVLLSLLLIANSAIGQRTGVPTAPAAQSCGNGFAGSWRSKNDANAVFNISVRGTTAQGDYRVSGQPKRILRGSITRSVFSGEWFETDTIDRGRNGSFSATLSGQQIQITFRSGQFVIETTTWICPSSSGPGPGPGPTVTPTPPASPTPTPRPRIRSDHDTDNFQTFDALSPEEQEQVLKQRGPRLPINYNANDLSMRVFVKSGWPILLDYGLRSADFATLWIEIPGLKPERVRLEPTDRQQIRLRAREWRRGDVRVAKLRIETSTPDGDFRLYGFAMGENVTQALQGTPIDFSHLTLAFNAGADFADFLNPQVGTSVEIKVTLPKSLRLGQSPRERIEFSCISTVDFSGGRWEWWRVAGTNWEKVWQKETGGISRNQPKSQTWDGIITSAKVDSIGFHSLSISLWQGGGSDEREWVASRTDPALEVFR